MEFVKFDKKIEHTKKRMLLIMIEIKKKRKCLLGSLNSETDPQLQLK